MTRMPRALSGSLLGGAVAVVTALLTTPLLPAPASAADLADITAAEKVGAKAPSKVTFGIAPARGGVLDTRPFLNYGVTGGASLQDSVVLLNYSAEPVRLRPVATDAVATSDGSFSLRPSAERPDDAGSWIHLRNPAEVVVPPAVGPTPGQVVEPFTVEVPQGAAPGDHVGGIAAVLTSKGRRAGSPNLDLEQRVATRVYLRVAGTLDPRLVVEQLHVDYSAGAWSGTATVSYRVRNAGNVKLGAHQQVEVDGWFGPKRTASPVDVPLLFPGSSVDVRTILQGVWPAIRDTATVRLLPLRLQGDVDGDLREVRTQASFWALPWVVVAALLLGLAALWWLRRRRKGEQPYGTGRHARPRGKAPQERQPVGVAFVAGLVVLLGLAGHPALAQAVPYTDGASSGSLTFCDSHGKELRSGELATRPVAAKVVLSSKAPAGYGDAGATATLLGFQPREGVDPAQWSGEFITGPSRFQGAVPAVAGALDDITLGELAADFPPRWDGLLQLRVYLGAPGKQPYKLTYDTADVRVADGRWTMVRGGGGDCSAAKAVTVAQILGVAPTSTPSPAAAPVRSGGGAATTGSGPARASAPDGANPSAVSTPRPAVGGGLVLPLAGGLAASAVVLALARLTRRRPRAVT